MLALLQVEGPPPVLPHGLEAATLEEMLGVGEREEELPPVLPVSVLEATLEEYFGGGERMLEQCCRDTPVFTSEVDVALFEGLL